MSGPRKKARQSDRYLALGLRAIAFIFPVTVILLLGIVAINGFAALLKPGMPFFDVSFLIEKPQTLHVFKPAGLVADLSNATDQLGSVEASGEHPDRKELRRYVDELRERISEETLTYSDEELRRLGAPPSPEQYLAESYAYSAGGIAPAIIGTVLLVFGATLIATSLGLCSALFLSEYSRPSQTVRIIRSSIQNLAGVPSVVFGIFGFGIFVLAFGWGVSLLAGWFTLAIMALPMIISDSESALRRVPADYREGSLALGASKWTSIRSNVIPYALPEILASAMLSVAKIAGETAPILFTAAFAFRDKLPWESIEGWPDFFFQGVMALPYHIYVVSVKLPHNEFTHRMQFGSAFVILTLVGAFAMCSILLRRRLIRRYPASEKPQTDELL